MTSYEFGDVVLVPFPFTDQSASKRRPAVVVSSTAYHADHSNLILMGISSQISALHRVGEVMISDWKAAGLIGPSVVKAVMTTVERKAGYPQAGSAFGCGPRSCRTVTQANSHSVTLCSFSRCWDQVPYLPALAAAVNHCVAVCAHNNKLLEASS